MDVLYTKYNYHRLPEFQVATSIVREGGRKRVVKRALAPQARGHLERVRRAHLRFAEAAAAAPGGFEPAGLREAAGPEALVYDFVEGASLDTLLFAAFRQGDRSRFWALLDDYLRRLQIALGTAARPAPEGQEEIGRVFGRTDFPWVAEAPGAFLSVAMVDLIFDNVIVAGERRVLVDNEWVFAGSVPAGYVAFRALFEFYQLKWREFGVERFAPYAEALRRCGIDAEAAARYREMEDHFQTYVCGAERLNFNLRFLKEVETLPHVQEIVADQARRLQEQAQALQELQARFAALEAELRVRTAVLAEIQTSYGYRLLRAACRGVDRLLPPGTRRRRMLAAPLRGVLSVIGRIPK